LQHQSRLSQTLLVSEFDAMLMYNKLPEEWFAIDRGWRALMIAHQRISAVMKVIQDSDNYDAAKRQSKRNTNAR
jgi:hypothetical protein